MPIKQFALTVFFQKGQTTLVQLPSIGSLESHAVTPSDAPSYKPDSTLSVARDIKKNSLHESSLLIAPPPTMPSRRSVTVEMPDSLRANVDHPLREPMQSIAPPLTTPRHRSITFEKPESSTALARQLQSIQRHEPYPTRSLVASSDHDDLDYYVPRLPDVQGHGHFLYTESNCHQRKKKVVTRWYTKASPGPLDHPPELPYNHKGLQDNVIFVHLDQQKQAETHFPRNKKASLKFITMWIWDASEARWEPIEYGAQRVIDGHRMRLSLYRGGADPEWISLQSWKRNSHIRN
ncbi:hypothetical protein GGU11DRAFT_749848 [Lentinula aff. detonsa]|nr:hypothetical protein GGU11DRAFT_749848 [Lentinula aff. detonsa]